jgi:peptide subunit release factor 1 (eRF1)
MIPDLKGPNATMATDPTRRIREQEVDDVLVVRAKAIAEQLASLEPSPDVPVVTVTLDWRVEGTNPGRQPDAQHPSHQDAQRRSEPDRSGEERSEESARRRPSRQQFEQQMDALLEQHGPRGAVYDSLAGDAERISRFLDHEIDPSAKGAYIVSCSAKGIFETVLFGLPLPTRISTAPTPALTELVRLDEDYPGYAVLLADQREANLLIVSHGTTDRSVMLESTLYPRKQMQGGWSQRRFQARADERVEAFARDISDEVQKAIDDSGADALVLAGDEVIMSVLETEFHETVSERIVDKIRLDNNTPEHELIERTMPIAVRAERKRERDAADRLSEAIGADTFGAGGTHRVLEALQAGQVETLLMNADFEAQGWADYTLPAYGAGDLPTTHPFGGDVTDLAAVDLRDEMVRLAVLTDAEIEIVHTDIPAESDDFEEVPAAGGELPRASAAKILDEHGGVGAILRFVMGAGPTEEESAAQAQA